MGPTRIHAVNQSMRWIRKAFIFLLVLFVAGGSFSLFHLFKSSERLRDSFLSQLEEELGVQLHSAKTDILLLPFPSLRMRGLRLEPSSAGLPEVEADEAAFSFQFLPLLVGQFRLSGVSVRGGQGTFGGIPLERIEFKLKGLRPNQFAPFQLKAGLAGGKDIFRGKGRLGYRKRSETLWKGLGLVADVTLNLFSPKPYVPENFAEQFPPELLQAQWQGVLHLEKKMESNTSEGLARVQIKEENSRQSGPLPISVEAKFLWDFQSQTAELKQLTLTSRLGQLAGAGTFHTETGEIREARLNGRKVVLEELVRYFPGVNSLLPVATGFSGESDFDLSLKGTWDYLSLHANWDLTSAVVTYGKVFSKPKDFPMRINCDLLLKGGSLLSGDISVRLKDSTIKGALVNFDLKTTMGELTLLTNKFDLGGWSEAVPLLRDYEMSGSAKVLLTFKGNLTQLGESEKMANLTLDNVTLLSPEGKGIRKAKALIDIAPLSLRIKGATFEMGGASLQIDSEIYSPGEHPQGTFRLTSPALEPFALLEDLKEGARFSRSQWARLAKMEAATKRFLPSSVALENLVLDVKIQHGKLMLESLGFQALEGSLRFQGARDWPSENPAFWLETHVERVSLSRYFEGLGNPEPNLEGNFFFTGKLEGQGAALSGQGSLSITNGEWRSLDLVQPLRNLKPFQDIPQGSGSTRFHDIKANWKYGGGKFDSEDFLLNSDDFWIEGKGNLSTSGVLNSRLDIYLSKSFTEERLRAWKVLEELDGKQLGPIPYLVVGNLAKPEPKIDDRLVAPFLEAVLAKKFRRILKKPFKE